jgi:hypothetical protein
MPLYTQYNAWLCILIFGRTPRIILPCIGSGRTHMKYPSWIGEINGVYVACKPLIFWNAHPIKHNSAVIIRGWFVTCYYHLLPVDTDSPTLKNPPWLQCAKAPNSPPRPSTRVLSPFPLLETHNDSDTLGKYMKISHTEIFWWQKIGKPRKNLRSSWNGRGSWVPVLQFFVCFCGDRTWVTNGHWWIIGMTNRINKVMGDQWFMDLWVYIGWLSLIILTPTNIDPAKQGAG